MFYRFVFSCVFVGVLAGSGWGESTPLPEVISLGQQDWGEIGINEAAHAAGKPGRALQIGEQHYATGIGTHANSQLLVDLWGEYTLFEAEVGVQAHPDHDRGSVIFQVFVDGEERFNSGVLHQADATRAVRIPLDGAQEMRLVVKDAGDGITNDLANWAEARLTRAATGAGKRTLERLDAAPFAQVMYWDPGQAGSHPGRVEELSVEQIFLGEALFPEASGAYRAPAGADGRACIGLQWYENRYITEVVLRPAEALDAAALPETEVQWWVGESEWQGDWEKLQGKLVQEGDAWVFRVAREDMWKAKIGIQKVRWVFPASAGPVRILGMEAYTRSHAREAEIALEMRGAKAGQADGVQIRNGVFLEGGAEQRRVDWRYSEVLPLRVRYLATREGLAKSDQTVLCFEIAGDAFGVGVEDVLKNGCVYVPDFGLYVRALPDGPSFEEHLKAISGHNTVLQDVRAMPDQRFDQALAHVHRAVQNNGPTMLSLACDNHKFTVYEDGGVQHRHDHEIKPEEDRKALVYDPKYPVQVGVQLDSSKPVKESRTLEEGWMPILNTGFKASGVQLRQRAFVAPYENEAPPAGPGWLNAKPLFVAEYVLENPRDEAVAVTFQLSFGSGESSKTPASMTAVPRGATASAAEALLAFADYSGMPSFTASLSAGLLTLQGRIAAGGTERCLLYLPGWAAQAEEAAAFTEGMGLDAAARAYWHRILSETMQVEIPEPLLEDVIYASQVHCLMTARNELDAKCVAPWCGADRYGPLESESQAIIYGMALMGHDAFAQRSLDYFIRRYNQDGLLTTGYTLMGVGWHLWTLADYYALYHSEEWLREVAPRLERACQWISRECEKTQRLRSDGSKPLEYGLVAPGVAADWSRFAYVTRSEGEYYAGLMGVARSYADIDYPGGAELLDDAADFRANIRRAYERTQAMSPVVQLRNGTWVPYCPALLGCFGRVMDLYPNEDGGRSWGKDMSMGAHNLVVLGVFDERDRRSVEWIANYLEDYWCVQGGMGAYTLEETTADWFNLGGFSKVQPYYTRLVEMYGLMDDVKPFIRSYFNAMPSLLNRENLNLWEHFGNGGAWNKPHETGWFLAQTRLMLVMERGQELWLAPYVTTHWLEDGMKVGVQKAPTRFGTVSYEITSHAAAGYIEARVEVPARQLPAAIVLRLRHPEEKQIQSVMVNGKAHSDFDAEKSIIRITGAVGTLTVRAAY